MCNGVSLDTLKKSRIEVVYFLQLIMAYYDFEEKKEKGIGNIHQSVSFLGND